MPIALIDSSEAMRLLDRGALLVDIREEDERSRLQIPGSLHAPLSALPRRIGGRGTPAVIFHCDCGTRTLDSGNRLMGTTPAPAFALDGGLSAWRAAGMPTVRDHGPRLSLAQQANLMIGGYGATGLALGVALSPWFFALPAVALLGLVQTGVTSRCGITSLLRRAPWNRDPDD